VRLYGGHLVGSGLAVDERRQERRQPLALRAGLDPGQPRGERLPPLGQRAIDFRVGTGKDRAPGPLSRCSAGG
jgi:hypothetical protein